MHAPVVPQTADVVLAADLASLRIPRRALVATRLNRADNHIARSIILRLPAEWRYALYMAVSEPPAASFGLICDDICLFFAYLLLLASSWQLCSSLPHTYRDAAPGWEGRSQVIFIGLAAAWCIFKLGQCIVDMHVERIKRRVEPDHHGNQHAAQN